MKICFMILLLLIGSMNPCCAEEVLESIDLGGIREFAGDYGIEADLDAAIEASLTGSFSISEALKQLKELLLAPVQETLMGAREAIAPMLLLAVLHCMVSAENGAGLSACFLLRLELMLIFSAYGMQAMDAGRSCVQTAGRFVDAAAPALTGILAAVGMKDTAALASPAASLAGNIAENIFLKYGFLLCRAALCCAIAGNLSPAVDLNRLTHLFKKVANWGSGLATTVFTALLALQDGITESIDSVAVRTAKFAVDSASPVIGSGISDAWEGYLSGVMVAKNALGASGIIVLLLAVLQPIIRCLGAMLILNLIAALLDVFGEREGAHAAEQIASVCQMALSLSTASVVIATVLLGTVMSAGRSLFG